MAKRENRFEARSRGTADPSSSDELLVRRLLDDDVEAFERLYERYAPRLYALCLRMLRTREHAEEVLQDSLWQLWSRPDRFDASRGQLSTFLFQIARSRCLDRLRRERLRSFSHPAVSAALEVVDVESASPTPLQSAFMAEQRARVVEALDGLPAECREILVLAYFEGFTRSEISEQLGIPVGTVKSRARRGLLLLKERFESGGAS